MEGYRLVDQVEVIAVADPVPAACRQYQGEYGIPQGYASYEEMLEGQARHRERVHLAAAPPGADGCRGPSEGESGDLREARGRRRGRGERMVEACEQSGTKRAISHQRLFTPGWEKARQLMREPVIGEPLWVDNRVAEDTCMGLVRFERGTQLFEDGRRTR
jgi:predicted dehydrogenase